MKPGRVGRMYTLRWVSVIVSDERQARLPPLAKAPAGEADGVPADGTDPSRQGSGTASSIARTCSIGPRPASPTGISRCATVCGRMRLHVVGGDVVAPAQHGLGLGRAHHGDAGARRQALQEPAARPGGGHQVLHVVEQRVGRMHLQHLLLQQLQVHRRQGVVHRLDHAAPVGAVQQLALGRAVRVAERDAHQEAVQLRLGQRESAQLVVRVLRGDHEEGRGQGARLAFDRDLLFLHRLEQGALRLGAGAVDLVGQQHLREDRARDGRRKLPCRARRSRRPTGRWASGRP